MWCTHKLSLALAFNVMLAPIITKTNEPGRLGRGGGNVIKM